MAFFYLRMANFTVTIVTQRGDYRHRLNRIPRWIASSAGIGLAGRSGRIVGYLDTIRMLTLMCCRLIGNLPPLRTLNPAKRNPSSDEDVKDLSPFNLVIFAPF
jgi:hypothetical protein